MTEPSSAVEGAGVEPGPAPPPSSDALQALPTISLLFMITGSIRSFVLSAIALFTVSGGQVTWLVGWLVVLILPAVVFAVLRYATFRYHLGEEELHWREGLLNRNERHVPYSRIQNVDLVQNPIHRWLGVATVRLETASGGKPEAAISVLPMDTVETLRRRVLRDRRGAGTVGEGETAESAVEGADEAEDGRALLAVPASELALLGFLSDKGMLVVAAGVGLLEQVGFFDNLERFEAWLPAASVVFDQVDPASWSPLAAAGFLVVVVVLFVGLTRVLSAAWILFTLWGFRLERRGDDLRSAYGLLTRITATIPRRRVQLMSFRESLLQGWLGRVSVQVETAGGGQSQGSNEQGPGASRLWLAPMMPRPDLAELVDEVLPGLDIESLDWRPISRRAKARLLRKHLLGVALLVALAVLAVGLWGLVALVLVPWAWLRAVRSVARAGWTITDDTVLYRSGPWGRSTSAVPFSKVQSVTIGQSPFDRRWGMATLQVDTAGARLGGHRVDIAYLDTVNAHALARHLANQASRRSFRW